MRSAFAMMVLAATLVLAASAGAVTTITVVNNGAIAYKINGVGNATLHLVRGESYDFDVTANGHPFYIKTINSIGTGNQFTNGVTGNGTQNGTLSFDVPPNAPNQLFYNCEFHGNMSGSIQITSAATPALTPLGIAALILLLGIAGIVIARRRTA